MIIDIRWEIKDGVPVLMVFVSKSIGGGVNVDGDGYMTLDIKDCEWREVKIPDFEKKL